MKIAVLGAGVSGLSAARLLVDKGHSVIVYEKNHTVGGLARTRFKDGYLYDPHGGHILNSKHKEVMDWVFSIMPKDRWQFTERKAKIFFNGRYVSYPFELSLCELDTEDAVDCIHDFVLAQDGDEPANFKEWLLWNFGKGIASRYMIPYNEKIWAYPLEQMETQWMRGKMPLPTKKEMIRSMLLKDPRERKMPHSTFYYPLHGGIQSMVDTIAVGLDIKTDYSVKKIAKVDGKWSIDEEQGFDLVISTIPLPELPKVMHLPDSICGYIQGLKYNSLTTVLFNCPPTDVTWLYVPSHEFRSHRVGYQSALTPYACPKGEGCGALEIIGPKFDVDVSFAQQPGILPAELGFKRVLDCEFTEYAYVIHDLDYRRNVENIIAYFKADSTFRLLGRWGTWNYKNMDLCMLDAMELVKSVTKDKLRTGD